MTSDSIAWDQIGIINDMREVAPLAAAPATERSERVGEEAEENRKLHWARTLNIKIVTS